VTAVCEEKKNPLKTLKTLSVDIAMLLVFRILSGGAAASVQSVGAGTVADIWEPKERGKAMGIFYLGPLCGPGLAPIVGGALTEGLHWRSTLWFLTIFGGVMLVLILLCLPETLKRRAPSSTVDNNFQEDMARVVFKKIFGPFLCLHYCGTPLSSWRSGPVRSPSSPCLS
jgi:MFS family permease